MASSQEWASLWGLTL